MENPLPIMSISQRASSCPGCSMSDSHLLVAWESFTGWPKCLGPSTHTGNLEGALVPSFRLA